MRSTVWPLVSVGARGIVRGYATANARRDTMSKLLAYRGARVSARRCLVPASWFVEWQAVAGSRVETSLLVARSNDSCKNFVKECASLHG